MRHPEHHRNTHSDALDVNSLVEFDELVVIGEHNQPIRLQLSPEAIAQGADAGNFLGRYVFADFGKKLAYPSDTEGRPEAIAGLSAYEVYEVSYCLAGKTHAKSDLSLGSYHSPAARQHAVKAMHAASQPTSPLSHALASAFRTRHGDRVLTELTTDLTEGRHSPTASGRARHLVISALETLCTHLDDVTPTASTLIAAEPGYAKAPSPQPGPGH